jgi:hypothetical protein
MQHSSVETVDVAEEEERDLSIKPELECLSQAHLLHQLFPAAFIENLCEQMHEIPASTSSNNMYAIRHFVRSPELATELLSFLPPELGVCSLLLTQCPSAHVHRVYRRMVTRAVSGA